MRLIPITARAELILEKHLIEMVAPRWEASKRDREEPIREKVLRDTEDPRAT